MCNLPKIIVSKRTGNEIYRSRKIRREVEIAVRKVLNKEVDTWFKNHLGEEFAVVYFPASYVDLIKTGENELTVVRWEDDYE